MDQGVLIRQLQGMLDGKTIRTGTVTLTFAASTDSGLAVVTHGLSGVPVFVQVANRVEVGVRTVIAYREDPGATTFRAFGRADSAFTGTSVHQWVAIG